MGYGITRVAQAPPQCLKAGVPMPELPEVETVRRGLEPLMAGHTFTDVETRRADLRFPFPERFAARLKGAKIKTSSRRAKYLAATLSTGEVLVMHLGMTGRFFGEPAREKQAHQIGDYEYDQPADAKHAHAEFRMSGGSDHHLQRSAPLRLHAAHSRGRACSSIRCFARSASSRSAPS